MVVLRTRHALYVVCIVFCVAMVKRVSGLEHRAETQRLREQHGNSKYELNVQYDQIARNLAVESYRKFDKPACKNKRCFNRYKTTDCPSEYRCYSIFISFEPYSTRTLVLTYFKKTLPFLKKHFSSYTHFGCVTEMVYNKAGINCVYMKLKNSAIAARRRA